MRSLTEVATIEGYAQDRHGSQTMVVGIDARWVTHSIDNFCASLYVLASG